MLIDIHTHTLRAVKNQKQILSVEPTLSAEFLDVFQGCAENEFLSLGIHPWHALSWNLNDLSKFRDYLGDSKVLMIGEIGLDKASVVPFSAQILVLNAQIEMAEQVHKPVILHIVRAMSEIIEIKRMHQTIPAWILHGFRGGKEEAEQYTRMGFYLSFGPKFKKEGLLACPPDKFFLETDESGEAIALVYERVEGILGCSAWALEKQIESNFDVVFKK